MKKLEARVECLEQRIADKGFIPSLIYFDHEETEEQARARYQREHGFDYPKDMKVIRFTVVDASKKVL